MQYCVVAEHVVVPQTIVVLPLDEPEVLVPELDVVVPELDVVVPELLVAPELVEVEVEVEDVVRPLDEPLLVVVCWLLVDESPSSPNSPRLPEPPVQATTRATEKETTTPETKIVRERESMVGLPRDSKLTDPA